MEDVTVKVPVDRLGEFYETYGRWLRGEQKQDVVVDVTDQVLKDWDLTSDLELAAKAWADFPARAKLVYGTLIDAPAKKFTGRELADLHDIPNGMYGVAGVFAHPGRQIRKLGRKLPQSIEPNPRGGSFYWMEAGVADLFRRAKNGGA
jgi:hypothetical protein